MRATRSILVLVASVLTALTLFITPLRALAGPQDGLPPPPADIDRSTPRRTVRLFIEAAREGDYNQASYALDLSDIPPAEQAARGRRLARQLKFVIDRELWPKWGEISDDPAGRPDDGPRTDEIGAIPLGDERVPIIMTRAAGPEGAPVWLLSRQSVASIDDLYQEYGPGRISEALPPALSARRFFGLTLWQWIGLFVAPLLAWALGVLLAAVVLGIWGKVAKRTHVTWDDRLLDRLRSPLRALLMLLLLVGLVRVLRLSVRAQDVADRVLQTSLLLAGVWLVMRILSFISDAFIAHATEGEADSTAARASRTKILILHRVASVLVMMLAAALILLQFEVVRKVGISLLASAGVAGIVLGLAAQKSISTLLAGLQISIAQPVRIGDSVVVEGEFGTIEEISLTYVIVKVWDLRRLVIPISYFLEKPVQNWTKVSPELLGTVTVAADFTVPVEKVREEVRRLCAGDALWDGKTATLIVEEARDRTIGLRALVSAADAGKLSDLRNNVREGLVSFLQRLDGGQHLPKVRVEAPALERAASGP